MTHSVFIGYDSREPRNSAVCRRSIERFPANTRVLTYDLRQDELRHRGLYTRPIDVKAATEFSLTRFLIPELAHIGERFAVFCDCDFVFTRPIVDMINETVDRQPNKAIWVVKHDVNALWQTAHGDRDAAIKMNGVQQLPYPRKWWSALVIWNLFHYANLRPDFGAPQVNSWTPAQLHRFSWLQDTQVGDIDPRWHWLDGYSEPTDDVPWGIHYTRGTPELGYPWTETRYAHLWNDLEKSLPA